MADQNTLPSNLILIAGFLFVIGAFMLENMVSGVFERIETMFAEPDQTDALFYGSLFLNVLIGGAISWLLFWSGYLLLKLKPKGFNAARGFLWVLSVFGGIALVGSIFVILFQEQDFVNIGHDDRAEFFASISKYIFYWLAVISISIWSIRSLKHESIRNLFIS